MIEVQYDKGTAAAGIPVKIDGKLSGKIKHKDGWWQYFPKGQREGGEKFASSQACAKSLQDEGYQLPLKDDAVLGPHVTMSARFERVQLVGPMTAQADVFAGLNIEGWRVTFSGPYSDRKMSPKVDPTRFKIVAEREIKA